MKSPFALFRKHQKVLMVVLTGLAMFAFIVLDSLTQNMEAFPPIFGCILGVSIAWAIARNAKHLWTWLAVGGIAGILVGTQFQTSTATQAAVKTSFGNITRVELNDAVQRRNLVNEFMRQVFFLANEGEERPDYSLLRSSQFGGNGDPTQEALMHIITMHEADKMNVYVSNDTVSAHIDRATSNKLSAADYTKALRGLNLSDQELFNLIREQIASQLVRRELSPKYFASPADYWEAFKKVNVRQELAIVPIAVEAFLDQIPEPKEDALKPLFEEHKEDFPREGEVGFRQPGRIQLAYLEFDYETVAKTVPEVTDEEIVAFYEENKEDFRNFAPDTFPPVEDGAMAPEGGTSESAAPADGPALVAPEAMDPATSTQAPPATSTENAAPAPSTTTVPPAGTSSQSSNTNRQGPFGNSMANILDESAPPASTSEAPVPAASSTTPPPATTSEPAPASTTEAPPMPAPEEPLPEYRPLDDGLKSRIREQLKRQRVLEKMGELSAKARGELFTINSQYASATDDQKPEVANKIRAAVESYAKKNGLRYVETPFYSVTELEESEDHPIGSSSEPSEDRFEQSDSRSVIEQHFGPGDLESIERQKYLVFDAADPRTLNQFLHWQIGFKESHVPTWDEEGVQEQVAEAWKRLEAEKLAEKRAEEVAQMLKESEQTWKESLESVTETGKEGAMTLNVTYSGPFSWVSPSTAPNPYPFMPPPLELTEIPILLGGTSEKFMETVFQDLSDGEIGVAWSANRNFINVVRVDNRTDVEQLRTQFMATADRILLGMSPLSQMVQSDYVNLIRKWNTQIFEQYDIEWVEEE